ncbi:hypothetical protein P3T73_05315 [Kiritimatiellota bacterium B12222]|nr:hypothetical protein P3T73_05315 [Kiritimatiellota bacterium B12222]
METSANLFYVGNLEQEPSSAGETLVFLFAMDERVSKKEKLELYNWCLNNKKTVGFDVQKFSINSPVVDGGSEVPGDHQEKKGLE